MLANPDITPVNTSKDMGEPGEILSARTANAKVFDLGGGKRRAKIYTRPIHHRGNDGMFLPLDLNTRRKPMGSRIERLGYETKAGPYHAHFDATKPWNYRFEVGESWIEYEALFAESPVLSIDVETTGVGVKETITLLSKKATTRLSWRITRSPGITGIITPPPTAVDVKGKDVPVTVSMDGDVLTYDVDTTGAIFPVAIDPTSVEATNDGYLLLGAAGSYAAARNAVTATSVTAGLYFGQRYVGGKYYQNRAFFSFVIPDIDNLDAASLFAEGRNNNSKTDFDACILNSTYSDPLVVADFEQFDGWQASGAYNGTVLNDTWNSSSYSATWNEIVFNATGLTDILAGAATTMKFAMISSRDYANTTPTGSEYIGFEGSGVGGKEPYLSLIYTVAGSIPVFMNHYRRLRG